MNYQVTEYFNSICKRHHNLGAILILALLVIIGITCHFAAKIYNASHQRNIACKIRNYGGEVLYVWQISNQSGTTPNWLSTSFGMDSVSDIVCVDLSRTKITNDNLACLSDLHALTSLHLEDTDISDAGLKYIRNLNNLNVLWLSGTKITDTGLKHLKALKALRSLILTETQITDAGLENLSCLYELELLSVRGTHVTNAGVDKLQSKLPNCVIVQ